MGGLAICPPSRYAQKVGFGGCTFRTFSEHDSSVIKKQTQTQSGQHNRKRREVLTADDLRDPKRPTCSVVHAAHLLGISKGSE